MWVDDGCSTEDDSIPDDVVGAFQPIDSTTAGVRCCDSDGSTCTPTFHCTQDTPLSYHEAVAYCDAEQRQLCTKDELDTGLCCATGGSCDSHAVWTSTQKGSNVQHNICF